MRKPFKILLLIIILPVVLLLIADALNNKSIESSFEKHMEVYINIPNLKESLQNPYIVGKVIVVDKSSNKLDTEIFNHLLFGAEKAKRPTDVGTIIWVSCKHERSGNYAGKYGETDIKGYKNNCEIKIIDKSKSIIINKMQFEGNPPSSISYKTTDPKPSDVYAGRPVNAIVEYIKKLPHR